jgi:uncharacterized protein
MEIKKMKLFMHSTCAQVLLAGLSLLTLLGCQPTVPEGPATVPMQIGNRTFHLEIANTRDRRRIGLMYRKSLPPDHGMIFLFTDEVNREFWMKNVPFPLDIIYLNSAGKVVSILHMKPMDETTTLSNAAAQFAIELNQGTAQSAGIKIGDTLQFPPEIKEAAARAQPDDD